MKPPYVLYLGRVEDPLSVKTSLGLWEWRPDLVVGQIVDPDSPFKLPGCPEVNMASAYSLGAETLILGMNNIHSQIDPSWHPIAIEAMQLGLNVACGLHGKLSEVSGLAYEAEVNGVELFDFRHQRTTWPIGTGERRTGNRLLTISNDCSSGKKFTAYALSRAAKEHNVGFTSQFVPTGQTGRLIHDDVDSVVIDTVPADYISGAMEYITPNAPEDHWYFIEGQSALFHPSYSGLTASMIMGAQPDVIVACIDPTRKKQRGVNTVPASILDEIELTLRLARTLNPMCRLGGFSYNSSKLTPGEDAAFIAKFDAIDVPIFDPAQPISKELLLDILRPR